MSKLYIVATPIGNLGDITLRAIETLKNVHAVLAEDTRVARKLLSHFGISKQLISFQEYSKPKVLERILGLLDEGKDLALVTDAGTPGMSDPGQRLIKSIQDLDIGVEVIPIPGPSSLSAIISVSDINLSEFIFLSFPPHKKGRQTFFKKVARHLNDETPVILFESPHRILKTLGEIESAAGDKYVNIGRELTKIYEEVFRGNVSEALRYFTGEKERGEFVIIIDIK